MYIIIKRNTGWMGSLSIIKIKLNNEKVGDVEQNKELKIEISENENTLKVSQFGAKSNKIKVKDGDTVEITRSFFSRFITPLILLISLLPNMLPDSTPKNIIYSGIFIFLGIFIWMPEYFNIKVVETKNTNEKN